MVVLVMGLVQHGPVMTLDFASQHYRFHPAAQAVDREGAVVVRRVLSLFQDVLEVGANLIGT